VILIFSEGKKGNLGFAQLNKTSLVIAAHYHQTILELTRKISFGQQITRANCAAELYGHSTISITPTCFVQRI